MLLGFSVIHNGRKDERKGDGKKKNKEGREKSAPKWITRRKNNRKSNKAGVAGDLAIGVTPGRGFLSSISLPHATKSAFYLYSAVMFGISFEGGEREPLFSLAAVRLAALKYPKLAAAFV